MAKDFAWSYSTLSIFETCALKYKFKKDKVPVEKSKYMERGIQIHKLGEDYLKGAVRKLPAEYEKFKAQMTLLKKSGGTAERQFAFDRKWRPTEWFGDDTWFRAVLDFLHVDRDDRGDFLRIIDFKTGRPRDDYVLQVPTFTAAGLSVADFAKVNRASVEFWYLDHGTTLPKRPIFSLRKNHLEGIRKELTVRAGRMEKEKKFAATRGGHCSFCEYSKRKGGPCKY